MWVTHHGYGYSQNYLRLPILFTCLIQGYVTFIPGPFSYMPLVHYLFGPGLCLLHPWTIPIVAVLPWVSATLDSVLPPTIDRLSHLFPHHLPHKYIPCPHFKS